MVNYICRNCGHDVIKHDQTKPEEQRENGFCVETSRFQDRCVCDDVSEKISVYDKGEIIIEVDKTIFEYQNFLFKISEKLKGRTSEYESDFDLRTNLKRTSEKLYWLTYWLYH